MGKEDYKEEVDDKATPEKNERLEVLESKLKKVAISIEEAERAERRLQVAIGDLEYNNFALAKLLARIEHEKDSVIGQKGGLINVPEPYRDEAIQSIEATEARVIRMEEEDLPLRHKKIEDDETRVKTTEVVRNTKILERDLGITEIVDYLDMLSTASDLSFEEAATVISALRSLYSESGSFLRGLQMAVERFKISGILKYPALVSLDLETDQEIKRRKVALILPQFYSPTILDRSLVKAPSGELFHDKALVYDHIQNPALITARDLARRSEILEVDMPLGIILDKEKVPNDKVYETYFASHNPDYVKRLDTLITASEIPADFVQNRKTIVAIPAMNETSLLEVVQSFRASYKGDFEKDIAFVIYHNSKDLNSLTPEVRTAIEVVRKLSNVVVVEEEVPAFNTTGMAKKVVSDLVMRLQGPELNTPLIMADADIVDLSPNLVEMLLRGLNERGRLAAAPEFDYEEAYKLKYPVLGLIWEVRRDIGIEETRTFSPDTRHITYGMCYAINPRTLAMIGGIKPTEQFEDTYLTRELKGISMMHKMKERGIAYVHPVAPVNLEGGVVTINPDREIIEIMRGNTQWNRWLTEKAHQGISGMVRGTVDSRPDTDLPELGVLNPMNIVTALNRSVPFILPRVNPMDFLNDYTVILQWQSMQMYSQLKKHGVTISEFEVSVFVRNKGLVPQRMSESEFLQFIKDHPSGWVVTEILEVTLDTSFKHGARRIAAVTELT